MHGGIRNPAELILRELTGSESSDGRETGRVDFADDATDINKQAFG
jgi:hypothetical protein